MYRVDKIEAVPSLGDDVWFLTYKEFDGPQVEEMDGMCKVTIRAKDELDVLVVFAREYPIYHKIPPGDYRITSDEETAG